MSRGADAIRKAVGGANVVSFPGGGSGDDLNLSLAEKDLNDIGNAERFQARFGHRVLFVRNVGWHHYDGKRWVRDGADGIVRQYAHQVAISILEEVSAALKKGPREGQSEAAHSDWLDVLFKWAKTSGNRDKITSMLTEAAPYLTVGPEELDADPAMLNLANGTLRLAGACQDLMPHSRDDHLAKLMPVDFDEKATCPRFLDFMACVQPDEEVRSFLQRWIGYSMTGHTGEQKLVFNYGEGGNGKSVFVDLIADILGPYSATLPFSSLTRDDRARGAEATPDLARLPGARLVRVSEPEKGAQFAEAKIKAMTGGEPIIVRHLNRDFFEFKPQFKLMLSGNYKPRILGQDRGIWRRFLLVPWEVNVPEDQQDKDLHVKLWAERSGVLNWMLDGVRMWLESGLSIPSRVRAATDEYKADSDPLGRFLSDCVERSVGSHDLVAGGAMYDAYKKWCLANAERFWNPTSFGRGLAERGLDKERVGGMVRYVGVRLVNLPDVGNDEPPPPEPDDYDT